ncbi:hypothetical protein ACWDS7_48025, partial [Streptosporangium sp. NPDC003464]
MIPEDHDEIRELMVRHNPVPPHTARGAGPGAEEALRRVMRGDTARRPGRPWGLRGRGAALAVTALGVAVAAVVPFRIPPQPGPVPAPAGATPPPGPAGRAGPELSEGLARIARIAASEPLGQPPPRPMASFPPASAELLELATLAEARPRPEAGPWSYVRTEEWLLATTVGPGGATSEIMPWVVRRWTPVSGRGTYRTLRTAGRPFGDGGWARISPEVRHSVPGPAENTGRAADLRPRAATLSRSGPRLRGQLLATEPQTTMTRTRRLVRAMENLHSHDVAKATALADQYATRGGEERETT